MFFINIRFVFFSQGTKFQSNLNEIGKSEQKSSELDRKRNYNWPPDKGEYTKFN